MMGKHVSHVAVAVAGAGAVEAWGGDGEGEVGDQRTAGSELGLPPLQLH